MNTRKSIIALAIATVIGTSPLTINGPVFAADANNPETIAGDVKIPAARVADAVATASADAEDKVMIKTVDEAHQALREIRAARLAIFNGTPDKAKIFVDAAEKNLIAVQANVKDYAVMASKKSDAGESYIPFDSSLALSEGFVPAAEKKPVLDKANEHLTKGENKQAIELLKLANIDISLSAALIPANSSLQHVKDAAKLIQEKKYYEANLALKAVEDSVFLESFDINATPVQGQHG